MVLIGGLDRRRRKLKNCTDMNVGNSEHASSPFVAYTFVNLSHPVACRSV
jgi:hypothetical protein